MTVSLTLYRCTKCGITVSVAINTLTVACWRCQKKMKTVKVVNEPVLAQ